MKIILMIYSISITLFNILLLILNVEFKEICLFNLSYSIYFITISIIRISFHINKIDKAYFLIKDEKVKMN